MPSFFDMFFWPFFLFIIFAVIAFVLFAWFARMGQKSMRETVMSAESTENSENQPVIREKEIIREIVKIRCPYCNSLYDEKLDKCPNCGARHP